MIMGYAVGSVCDKKYSGNAVQLRCGEDPPLNDVQYAIERNIAALDNAIWCVLMMRKGCDGAMMWRIIPTADHLFVSRLPVERVITLLGIDIFSDM